MAVSFAATGSYRRVHEFITHGCQKKGVTEATHPDVQILICQHPQGQQQMKRLTCQQSQGLMGCSHQEAGLHRCCTGAERYRHVALQTLLLVDCVLNLASVNHVHNWRAEVKA